MRWKKITNNNNATNTSSVVVVVVFLSYHFFLMRSSCAFPLLHHNQVSLVKLQCGFVLQFFKIIIYISFMCFHLSHPCQPCVFCHVTCRASYLVNLIAIIL